jgi:hypothetical protein
MMFTRCFSLINPELLDVGCNYVINVIRDLKCLIVKTKITNKFFFFKKSM